MSLVDLMASDIDDVFLNTDEGAESVTYTPSGGTARTITVNVTGLPSEIVTEGDHQIEMDVIHVFAKRHATEGIDAPARGDTLAWQSRTYSWVGYTSKENANSGGMDLKFSAPSVIASGSLRSFQ